MAEEPVSRDKNFNTIASSVAGAMGSILFGGFFLFIMLVGVFADDDGWFITGILGLLIIGLVCITIVKQLTLGLLTYGEYLARLRSQATAPPEDNKNTPDTQP